MKPSLNTERPTGASPWTTRVDASISRLYGVEEVHNVWFMPDGWRSGIGAKTITMLIPECELQMIEIMPDGEPLAIISRRKSDFNVKRWLRNACELAAERKACLSLACDTAAEAELAAQRAIRWLPRHYQRVALERMSDPDSRIKEKLS